MIGVRLFGVASSTCPILPPRRSVSSNPVEVVALGVSVPVKDSKPVAAAPLPADYFYKGNFSIQVGSFSNLGNAERLKRRLEPRYENVHIMPFDKGGTTFHRVRIGQFADLNTAEANEEKLIGIGFSDAFVVAE